MEENALKSYTALNKISVSCPYSEDADKDVIAWLQDNTAGLKHALQHDFKALTGLELTINQTVIYYNDPSYRQSATGLFFRAHLNEPDFKITIECLPDCGKIWVAIKDDPYSGHKKALRDKMPKNYDYENHAELKDINIHSETSHEPLYAIPARYRRLENLHIVFWLFKDLCWVMLWKPLGLIMIVPTIAAALLITWQTRHIFSELLHNIAVALWIVANSYWMITEFYFKDDTLRYYAVIPFTLGILVIGYYYGSALYKKRGWAQKQ
jgi:hypothetical protein